MAKMRRRVTSKKATDASLWEKASSDVSKRQKQPLVEFYTPLGRMVTRPSDPKKDWMSYDQWAAAKTPFKDMVIPNPKRKF
jgi:hypothetical protein